MNEQVRISLSDDDRWQAVCSRDTRFDGQFWFGVRSTGVFCRPGCPARRPRRDRVVFFDSPQAALDAGFRPCRRCGAEQPAAPAAQMAAQACRMLEAEGPLPLAELARRFGRSPDHFARSFHSVTRLTPRQYAAALREQRLKALLRGAEDNPSGTVTGALYEAGYGSNSRLYETAPAALGMTPRAYKNGGNGMQIHYALIDTPLGRAIVAATERGICAVALGDDDESLRQGLAAEFTTARLEEGGGMLAEWLPALEQALAGENQGIHPELPLDVQATAFQRRVWEALRWIPAGQTRTYRELAEAIGQPSAVRAVAHACASNPVAVLTPCHRIIRTDGSLGGYRWGLARKQALLEREKARPARAEQ